MTQLKKEYQEIKAKLEEEFRSEFPDGLPDDEFDFAEESSLKTPSDMLDACQDAAAMLRDRIMVNGINVPMFGLLSMKAASTPIHVYGSTCKPLMDISNKGFTDGKNLYISSLWMRRMLMDEDRENGLQQSVLPWMCSMMLHLMRNHTRRLQDFDPEIATTAKNINTMMDIDKGFGKRRVIADNPEDRSDVYFYISDWLKKHSRGFSQDDIDKYDNKMVETIARLLQSEKERQMLQEQVQDQKDKKEKGKKGDKGQPQSGQPQPGQEEEGETSDQGQPGEPGENGGGSPQKGQGKGKKDPKQKKGPGGAEGDDAGDESPWDETSDIPMEDFAKIVEDHPELANLKKALDIPDADDFEKIEADEEEQRQKDLNNLQEAASQMNAMGNPGKYPGGHIVTAEADRVKADAKGKMRWKLGLNSFILGGGSRYASCDDVPNVLYYMDPEEMGMGADEGVFIPEIIPAKNDSCGVVLLDTSGSVDQGMLKGFLKEIFTLKRNNTGDQASEILVFSADTCLRGEPIKIDENTIQDIMKDGLKIYGRGGTDFATPLKELSKNPVMKEKKIEFVLYFTDLCASIPQKKDFPNNVRVAFITTPTDYSAEFARAVGDWASVYCIDKGVEVDLTADGLKDKSRAKPKR